MLALKDPCEVFKTSVWNKEWLMMEYQTRVVDVIIRQGWAIDEMVAGVSQENLLDEIWESYPDWAEVYLENNQMVAGGRNERD